MKYLLLILTAVALNSGANAQIVVVLSPVSVTVDGVNFGAVADTITNNPALTSKVQLALVAWSAAKDAAHTAAITAKDATIATNTTAHTAAITAKDATIATNTTAHTAAITAKDAANATTVATKEAARVAAVAELTDTRALAAAVIGQTKAAIVAGNWAAVQAVVTTVETPAKLRKKAELDRQIAELAAAKIAIDAQ